MQYDKPWPLAPPKIMENSFYNQISEKLNRPNDNFFKRFKNVLYFLPNRMDILV